MHRRIFFFGCLFLCLPAVCWSQGIPTITLGIDEATSPQQVSTALQVLFVLTVLSMAPAILLMTTSFTRIVIVLSIVRQSMGTQQMPPNQVIVGLALFLTFFVMAPTYIQINETALQPYLKEEISQDEALQIAVKPLREFMLVQANENELELLMNISENAAPDDHNDIPTMTLIPAFMLSELKERFKWVL